VGKAWIRRLGLTARLRLGLMRGFRTQNSASMKVNGVARPSVMRMGSEPNDRLSTRRILLTSTPSGKRRLIQPSRSAAVPSFFGRGRDAILEAFARCGQPTGAVAGRR
jgi:hypothetical protein